MIIANKVRVAFWTIAGLLLVGWTQAAWAQTKIAASDRDANPPSSTNFSNYYPDSSEKLISDLEQLLSLRTGKILRSDVNRVFRVQLKDKPNSGAPDDNDVKIRYASVPGVDWYFTLGGAEFKNGDTVFYFEPARQSLRNPEICLPEEEIIKTLTTIGWSLKEIFPFVHGEFPAVSSYQFQRNGTASVRFTGPIDGRQSCLRVLTVIWKNH